jgi:hypothetical protein
MCVHIYCVYVYFHSRDDWCMYMHICMNSHIHTHTFIRTLLIAVHAWQFLIHMARNACSHPYIHSYTHTCVPYLQNAADNGSFSSTWHATHDHTHTYMHACIHAYLIYRMLLIAVHAWQFLVHVTCAISQWVCVLWFDNQLNHSTRDARLARLQVACTCVCIYVCIYICMYVYL